MRIDIQKNQNDDTLGNCRALILGARRAVLSVVVIIGMSRSLSLPSMEMSTTNNHDKLGAN